MSWKTQDDDTLLPLEALHADSPAVFGLEELPYSAFASA
jgi:hypothetical protein